MYNDADRLAPMMFFSCSNLFLIIGLNNTSNSPLHNPCNAPSPRPLCIMNPCLSLIHVFFVLPQKLRPRIRWTNLPLRNSTPDPTVHPVVCKPPLHNLCSSLIRVFLILPQIVRISPPNPCSLGGQKYTSVVWFPGILCSFCQISITYSKSFDRIM